MENNIKENRKKFIRTLFYSLFLRNGYGPSDYFNYNVWFLKNIFKTENENSSRFEQFFLNSTSENDDVIKFLISRRLLISKNIEFKIKVEEFVNEIVDVLLNLHEENKRVDNLIVSYDAYKTKNYIEHILENPDKLFRHQDIFKSIVKISVEEIDNMQVGDFKISLLTSFIKDDVNVFEDHEGIFKEELLEFKLSNILRIKERANFKSDSLSEYAFPQIEFYSKDMKNKLNKFDSGTNLLYFQLKVENLNSEISEGNIIYSEKKPLIELFLSYFETLLNVTQTSKTIQTEMKIKNKNYENKFKLRLNLLLDPWTMASILKKILTLLQTTISYKVLTEHKWNTILFYFEEISQDIIEIINDEKQNKKNNCLII